MIISLLISVVFFMMSLFVQPKWLLIGLSVVASTFYFGFPNQDYLVLLIYHLGCLFLLIELYVPDFGIAGVIGAVSVVLSLYMHLNNLTSLILTILAVIFVALMTGLIMFKMGKTLSIAPHFVLNTSAVKEAGYSSQRDLSFLNGKTGEAMTALRPVGRGAIDGQHYEIMSSGEMMSAGEQFVVERVEGSRIYVRKEA